MCRLILISQTFNLPLNILPARFERWCYLHVDTLTASIICKIYSANVPK
jgi:hypothetical protein